VSAVVKKEGLVATATEFFLLESGKKFYMAHTIHIQDIDAYSERDLGKSRDMVVGMLPPKLAQSMINLALGTESPGDDVHLYDPFCGLGTVPIEALHMGITRVYASDISPEMTAATKQGVADYVARVSGTDDPALRISPLKIETLDGKLISTFPAIAKVTHIVTEGYLGRIFGQHSIKPELVAEEKIHLLEIYGPMFEGLAKAKWDGVIVMTIPCWETKESSIYFGEFYQLLGRHGFRADPLLADREEVKLTKYGSLIYRRPGQTVGREVVRIVQRESR
jgi:tRNA G10  N-methylase Trm11